MKKYGVQVGLYGRYFSKILWDSPGVLVYTVCLPLVFLVVNTGRAFFQPLTLNGYTNRVLPFIAWIIFSNTLIAISNVGQLRENGYLKQYRSLVVSVSVLIFAELVVNFGLLVIMLGGLGLVSGLVFHLSPLVLIGRLWLTLLLVTIPLAGYCLPLLAFQWRPKTLNTAVNALTLVVMLGSAGIAGLVPVGHFELLLNLVSPVYFVTDVFAAVSGIATNQYWGIYGATVLLLVIIGGWSYRYFKVLPTEGV